MDYSKKLQIIFDRKNRFISVFDAKTGMYMRTGILDENGKDTGKDPFMASYPLLIDVGIMGHCIHGKTGLCAKAGIGCYQSGMLIGQPNMSVEDFESIAKQSSGRCNQFALGGRGDPDQHEHFQEILEICQKYHIVPNFTTSGYGMTTEIAELCRKYCGAVAVSWYRNDYTNRAIELLLETGVKTNIHYVLGNNSIEEAIERLKSDDFPDGINAVIFLLHKPVGQGTQKNVLSLNVPRLREFFERIDRQHPFKVGLDSCTVPGVVNFCENIASESIDTCEGGRFSCYIGPDMVMVPCSFDKSEKFKVSLANMTIEEAWNSEPFDQFRDKMRNACPRCNKKEYCMGGCPLTPEIVLCNNKS